MSITFIRKILQSSLKLVAGAIVAGCTLTPSALAEQAVEHPFLGIIHITRTESSPRVVRMHIVQIDLTVPGIHFQLTSPGGTLETVRQRTLDFLNQTQAQAALNGHFFLPFPDPGPDAMLIGLAASNGNVFSAFEAPVQNYALVTDSPALNIDPFNNAGIVHRDPNIASGKGVLENVTLWNALAGSAQIVTNGVKTIPEYRDATHPDALLTPPGPANYSNSNSWYNLLNARTAIGLSQDKHTLTLFTVDRAGGSLGMSVGEVADLLIADYGVFNALNLDGGGSTTLAMQDPLTLVRKIANVSSDNPTGRSVASNLAVFALLDTVAPTTGVTLTPQANANGWNNSSVNVLFNATDNQGGGVQQIQYELSGAETSGPVTGAGATAATGLTTEGTTTAVYSAKDYSGNQEPSKQVVIRIDKTTPAISGLPTGCTLWPPNGKMVEVATVSATDLLSGVADGGLQVNISSNESQDSAEPDFEVMPVGPTEFKIYLRATRKTSRTYTLTATARDRADNWSSAQVTCSVPHDQRGGEARRTSPVQVGGTP